jgi:hypothetical protein
MMTKAIVYRSEQGRVEICRPSPWARLCAGVTSGGARVVIDPPTRFDVQVRRFGTEDLAPEWEETEEAFLARIVGHDVPEGATDMTIVEVAAIPADRTFRDAWNADLSVDMEKARAIHREALRQARVPLLTALDVAYARADEQGDTAAKQAVAAQKQELRDITADPAIDAAETPAQLKAVWPDVLKG